MAAPGRFGGRVALERAGAKVGGAGLRPSARRARRTAEKAAEVVARLHLTRSRRAGRVKRCRVTLTFGGETRVKQVKL